MNNDDMILAPVIAAALSTDQVISEALKVATKTNKNVFLEFGANWCPWCRKTEALLNDSQFATKFSEGYVVARVTVRERGERAALENPGWEEAMKRYRNAPEQDIPYIVVLDPQGNKIVDSYRPPKGGIPHNGGYPKTKTEIAAFLKLVSKTSSTFTKDNLKELEAYFTPAS